MFFFYLSASQCIKLQNIENQTIINNGQKIAKIFFVLFVVNYSKTSIFATNKYHLLLRNGACSGVTDSFLGSGKVLCIGIQTLGKSRSDFDCCVLKPDFYNA